MSVGWYTFLKNLAETFGSPGDEGEQRFIQVGTDVAAWSILISSLAGVVINVVEADLFYVMFQFFCIFQFALLLFTLEDFKAYLATNKVLKQRVVEWVTNNCSWIWNNRMFRSPEKIIKKVIQDAHVTNGREKTPSPQKSSPSSSPSGSPSGSGLQAGPSGSELQAGPSGATDRPGSGLDKMRKNLMEIVGYGQPPDDDSPAVVGRQSRPPVRQSPRLLQKKKAAEGTQTVEEPRPATRSTTTQLQSPPRSGLRRRTSTSRSVSRRR